MCPAARLKYRATECAASQCTVACTTVRASVTRECVKCHSQKTNNRARLTPHLARTAPRAVNSATLPWTAVTAAPCCATLVRPAPPCSAIRKSRSRVIAAESPLKCLATRPRTVVHFSAMKSVNLRSETRSLLRPLANFLLALILHPTTLIA